MNNSEMNSPFTIGALVSSEIQLKHVMAGHGLFSIALGLLLVLMPHSFSPTLGGNHIAHEFLRLYGALNLGLGWFAWRAERIGLTDGRIKKLAHFSVPEGHSVVHGMIGVVFGLIGAMYGFMRFCRKIKEFELPNSRSA